MVETASRMVELGSPAPNFVLPDVRTGERCSDQDFAGKPLLVMFICNHCPYVIHVIDVLAQLANEARSNGFGVVAISSNDIANYPQDDPQRMQEFARQHGFEFPYCYDESQAVAKAFQAECTPDFFVYDTQRKLCYRGQMDDARPGNSITVTGSDLRDALLAVQEGRPCIEQQVPSMGCNIKWKRDA